ncbi:MAG: DNA recombination/repair protein RecA, partial [Ruminococcus sp.]|nr:DNA recombination/repair protein RecA [Ruminococcus sp.]
TGGRALKFYSSVRIDIRRIETLKVNGEMVGSRTRAKVVKNKIAPPFKEAEFDIMYGEGISRVGELIDLAVKADVMQKSGAWFYYGETRLGQGRDNVKELLKSDDRLRNEIEAKLWENVDKLSTRPKKTAKAAATPVAKAEPAPAPAPAPAADKKKKTSKIDILVED